MGPLTFHQDQREEQRPRDKAQSHQDVEDGHRRLPGAPASLRVGCGERCGEIREESGEKPTRALWCQPRWDKTKRLTCPGRIWRRRFPRQDVNPCGEVGKHHWRAFFFFLRHFRVKSCPAEALDHTGDAGRGGGCYLCLLCSSGSADLHRMLVACAPTPTQTRHRSHPHRQSCLGMLRERKMGEICVFFWAGIPAVNNLLSPSGSIKKHNSPRRVSCSFGKSAGAPASFFSLGV